MAEGKGVPIARSIFALVVLCLITAGAGQFVVTFSGPPPRAAPVSVETMAAMLLGKRSPQGEGRSITLATADAPPQIGPGQSPDADRDAAIARAAGVPIDAVRGYYERGRGAGPGPGPAFGTQVISGGFDIGLKDKGRWRIATAKPEPVFTQWHRTVGVAFVAVLLLLAIPAWLLSRAISRPLRRLADAAEGASIGARAAIPLDGPREVRQLAHAVRDMKGRLDRQMAERATAFAAIAHDIGTPLARLAFRMEELEPAKRDRAEADLAEIRAMLARMLRLVREQRTETTARRVDLSSLLTSLADARAETGQNVGVVHGERIVVMADSDALKRLFDNLVDNAIRYGRAASIKWERAGEWVRVWIDDRGPGFPTEGSERLFEPFVRGDPSRNRETGGTGLGLAIAQSIARVHGGDVTLGNGAHGGRVTVRLPVVATS